MWSNGFNIDAGYGASGANAGLSYTGNVGKNKTPVKVGFTYGQKKGGPVKSGTHKMPNGKVMLNSAMKKKTSKKK